MPTTQATIFVFYIYPRPGYALRSYSTWAPAPPGVPTCDAVSPDLVLTCCLDRGHKGDRHMAFAASSTNGLPSLMAEWSIGAPMGTVPTPTAGCVTTNPWTPADQCRQPTNQQSSVPILCPGCFNPIGACTCPRPLALNTGTVQAQAMIFCPVCFTPYSYGQPCPTCAHLFARHAQSAPTDLAAAHLRGGPDKSRPPADRCECGSHKAMGTGKGQIGHSDWCPWSPK